MEYKRILIFLGIAILIVGLVIYFWFGGLPGKKQNLKSRKSKVRSGKTRTGRYAREQIDEELEETVSEEDVMPDENEKDDVAELIDGGNDSLESDE